MLKKNMEMRRIHQVLIKEEQKILRADKQTQNEVFYYYYRSLLTSITVQQ
jgi:hypothetical protein